MDTFAFRNDSRIHHRGKPDMYCNRCFLVARAFGPFLKFARFDPEAPRLPSAGYAERVWPVTRRPAWRPASAPAERIVIPGFASLRARRWPRCGPAGAALRDRLPADRDQPLGAGLRLPRGQTGD